MNKVLNNILFSGIFQGIGVLLPLLIMPYLIHTIGVDKFGIISIMLTVVNYLNAIVDYGFNLSATRAISYVKNDKFSIAQIYVNVILCKILLIITTGSILTLIVSLGFIGFNNNIIAGGVLLVIGRAFYPNWFLQGVEAIKMLSVFNFLLQSILYIPLLFFIQSEDDYLNILLIQGGFHIFCSICAVFYVYKKYLLFLDKKIQYSFFNVKQELVNGFSSFSISCIVIISSNLQLPILDMFVGYKEIGYYSAIEKLITTMKQVFAMIGTVAYPHMCGLTADSHTELQNFSKRFFACVIFLSFIVAICLCYYADYFLMHFLSINEKNVVFLLRLLSFVPVITAINLPFFLILLSYKKDKECNEILFLGLIVNAFVTLFLSWLFNSVGTCIAVLISETFVTVSLIYLLESKNSDYSIIKVN